MITFRSNPHRLGHIVSAVNQRTGEPSVITPLRRSSRKRVGAILIALAAAWGLFVVVS